MGQIRWIGRFTAFEFSIKDSRFSANQSSMLLCIGEVTETLALVVDDEVVVESTAAVLLLFFGGPMARVPMIDPTEIHLE